MPEDGDIDDQTRELALAFKTVAERAMGHTLTETEYMTMALSLGVERMIEDIIHPPEPSVLWDTIVAMVHRDPAAFAEFMMDSMEAAQQAAAGHQRDVGDRWQRYIG